MPVGGGNGGKVNSEYIDVAVCAHEYNHMVKLHLFRKKLEHIIAICCNEV